MSSRSRVWSAVAISVAALAAVLRPLHASNWIEPDIGDWFDADNWSLGTPASGGFGAWINNGGTAVASPLSPFYVGEAPSALFINVGAFGSDDVSGTLKVENLKLISDNWLNVGRAADGQSAIGSVITDLGLELGTFLQIGTADDDADSVGIGSVFNAVGPLRYGGALGVGVSTGGMAEGMLSSFGGGSAYTSVLDPTSTISVGRTIGGGIATGTIQSNVNFRGSNYFVGYSTGGSASGSMSGGHLTTTGALHFIGLLNMGSGAADGSVTLSGALDAQFPSPDGFSPRLYVGSLFGSSTDSAVGTATGSLSVGQGITGMSEFHVGSASSFTSGSASGSVEILSGDLAGSGMGGIFQIGRSLSLAGVEGEVRLGNGSVSGFGTMFVGYATQGGSAEGLLQLDNGGVSGNQLHVGVAAGGSDVSGRVVSNKPLNISNVIHVGRSFDADSTAVGFVRSAGGGSVITPELNVGRTAGGSADGTLLSDANFSTGNLMVGYSFGGGSSTGLMSGNDVTGSGSFFYVGLLNQGTGSAGGGLILDGSLEATAIPSGAFPLLHLGSLWGVSTNPASGNATGLMSVAQGISGLSEVNVGAANPFSSGSALGVLLVGSGDLEGASGMGHLFVGRSFSAASARGTLTLLNGSVSGFTPVNVGVGTGGGPVTGLLQLDNGGISASTLIVGRASNASVADGTVISNKPLNVSNFIEVGRSYDAGSSATGYLSSAGGGSITTGDLSVGRSAGGFADGTLLSEADIEASHMVVGTAHGGEATGRLSGADGTVHGTVVWVGLTYLGDGISSGEIDLTGSLTFTQPLDSFNPRIIAGSLWTNSGEAEGHMSVAQGVSGVSSVFVGHNVGSDVTGASLGSLSIAGGDLAGNALGGNVHIGTSMSSADADGSLSVHNGDIHGFDGALVGIATGQGAAVHGELWLANGNDSAFGSMLIGSSTGTSHATGTAGISNGVLDGGVLNVGMLIAGASGSASGLLEAQESFLRFDSATIGSLAVVEGLGGTAQGALSLVDSIAMVEGAMNVGIGGADGTVDLTRSLLVAGDVLSLEESSEAIFDIPGTTRMGFVPAAGLYSVIEAPEVALGGGTLTASFSFLPELDDFFDVIVTSQFDGISGGFGAVNIVGLPLGYEIDHGVVLNDFNYEVYRLNVTAIPEPAAMGLLGLAVIGLMRRGRR